MTKFIILALLIVLSACRNIKDHKIEDLTQMPPNNDSMWVQDVWDSLNNMTVLSFLDKIGIEETSFHKVPVLTIDQSETKYDWVKRTDIDTLLALVKSKKRCKCIVSPFSSNIPNDSAELGGYAIKILNAYKNKKNVNFGLYSCPKSDERKAEDLIKWWTHVNN